MYFSKKYLEEVRNCFSKSRENVQLEKETKTDQKTLVLENDEKAPGYHPASRFHRKWEKVMEFFERKNV